MKPIIRAIHENVPYTKYSINIPFKSVPSSIKDYNIDMEPDYQRDYIWTQEQKEKFVGSCIENSDLILPFFINAKDHLMRDCEIVDGKQRLNAICEWLDNKFRAKCPCGISIWHKDLDEISERDLSTSVTLVWKFVNLSKMEVMKFYLRLNSGGTIHSEDDLTKVKKMILESEKKLIAIIVE